MGFARNLVDLKIAIHDPAFARGWVPIVAKPLKYIYLEALGRVIYFDSMSDCEACEVAKYFFGREIDYAMQDLNLLDPERHVH